QEDHGNQCSKQILRTRPQALIFSAQDAKQIVGETDRRARGHHKEELHHERCPRRSEEQQQRSDEADAAHGRRPRLGLVRLRRILVSMLANAQAAKQGQRNRASRGSDRKTGQDHQSDHPGEIDPERDPVEPDQHAAAYPSSGLAPVPRHLSTTIGVCSSPFPCGFANSASSTARRATRPDAPSTLAFSKSLASTTAQSTPVRSSTDCANAPGCCGAKTMLRSKGGIVPV